MAIRSALINVMCKAADKAARSLRRDFGEVEQLQVSQKGPADFVSNADHKAEKLIKEELKKGRPSFGFLMEESGEHKGTDGEHRFIIDPLDGTTNFLHGIPHWCISIGLEKNGEMIAGLILDRIRRCPLPEKSMSPSLKDAVSARIEALGGGEGFFPAGPDGLAFIRTSRENLPQHMLYRPALCVVVQGAKQVMFGDRILDFAAMQALIVSVELPAFSRVTQARPDEPFLAVTAEFDVAMMRSVMELLDAPPQPRADVDAGVFVTDLDTRLADCLLRLVRMLETPKAVPILHASIMREICFWLLGGPHGDRICKLALPDSHTRRIADAIHILREDFARAIRIDELAAAARMSLSSFHQHFKTLTSMTPLQYQKHLRLLEARRLMVADGSNAANAAYEVGYESASQFSREYARMFGAPPRRDIVELRSLPA